MKKLKKRTIENLVLTSLMTLSISTVFAQDEYGIVAKPSTIWENPKITCCWENPTSANSEEREIVRNAVKNTWEKHSAVEFTGWNKCQNNQSGIRIFINDDGPHTKGLGTELNGKENGMVLNFTFNNWGCKNPPCGFSEARRKNDIRVIAVHEFGHALGIAHEHTAEGCKTCDAKPGGPIAQGSEYYKITTCDIHSVMNYCNPKWSNNGFLSDKDIDGIQFLYGTPSEKKLSYSMFSSGDNLKGYSYNYSTNVLSYFAWDNKTKKTKMYIRNYDGTFDYGSNIRSLNFSTGNNLRGLQWHREQEIISYMVASNGKTELIIRSYDGNTFGDDIKKIPFSSGDNIRGWSWNPQTQKASYMAVTKGKTQLIIRNFNGSSFGDVIKTIQFSSGDNIRSWNWEQEIDKCYYLVYDPKKKQTIVIKRPFDGDKFGALE